MFKREYTHIQEIEKETLAMREEGATRQEIADRFGLSKVQIKNWINRYNRKQSKLAAGILPRPKGRPPKDAKLVSKQSRRMRSSGCGWRIDCCGISAILKLYCGS